MPDPAYENFYHIGTHEEYYPVRLAVSQEIAVGAEEGLREVLARKFAATLDGMENRRRDVHSPDAKEPRQEWREQVMAAWLAPQLAWSGEHEYLEPDKHNLGRWFTHLGIQAMESDHTPLPISLEIGLAQGFKYAANRRYRRSGNQADPREWLADQAMEMLKRSALLILSPDPAARVVPLGTARRPRWIMRTGPEQTGYRGCRHAVAGCRGE